MDGHIHLFDPTRRGGVPWPTADDTALFRPALPGRYAALARPEGVVAAIVVESSPLPADNDWLLGQAASSDLIVGVIGDLDPAREDFIPQLNRLARDPLLRGIRSGNLWQRDLHTHLEQPLFLANLRQLASLGLVFESANPTPQLVADVLQIARSIPGLRIVVDHLPHGLPPEEPAAKRDYLATLQQLAACPNVYVKGSEILRQIGGSFSLTLRNSLGWLDTLWQLFGEDRLFFGSDWPNSDHVGPLHEVFALAEQYLRTRSPRAAHKFFCANSVAVYRWRPRTEPQRLALSAYDALWRS